MRLQYSLGMPAGSRREPPRRAYSRRGAIAETFVEKRCVRKSIKFLFWSREPRHRWLAALLCYHLEKQGIPRCDPLLTAWKTGQRCVARARTHTYASSTGL